MTEKRARAGAYGEAEATIRIPALVMWIADAVCYIESGHVESRDHKSLDREALLDEGRRLLAAVKPRGVTR